MRSEPPGQSWSALPRAGALVVALTVVIVLVVGYSWSRERSGAEGTSSIPSGRPTAALIHRQEVSLPGTSREASLSRSKWGLLRTVSPHGHPGILAGILSAGILHPADFDRETRQLLGDECDPLVLSYAVILRGLVLGPTSNLDLILPLQSHSTLLCAFILSLGAIQQLDPGSRALHRDLCKAIVYGPVLCRDSRLGLFRIGMVALRFDDDLLRLGFGPIRDERAITAALRLLPQVDSAFMEDCVRLLLDATRSDVVRFGISVVIDERRPPWCRLSAAEVIAGGGVSARAELLRCATDRRLAAVIRSTVLDAICRQLESDELPVLERLGTDPSPDVRRAVLHGLSCSPDACLDKGLDAAALVLRAERDSVVRALMVADLANNVRRIEKRANVLTYVALQDESPSCRLAALDGLVALGCGERIEIAGTLSVSDPDKGVRRRASEVFRALK